MLFFALENGIDLLNSCSDYLLPVYRNTSDFLYMDLVTFKYTELFIISVVNMDFLEISVHNILSSANSFILPFQCDGLFFFFLSNHPS